jgi:phospholipase C
MKNVRRALTTRVALGGAVVALVSTAVVATLASAPNGAATAATTSTLPPVGHVFVVNFENKGYDQTFGADSPAPYLSKELRAKGQLLTQYYGIGHNSLTNYIAEVSGQGPDSKTQADCQVYTDFVQVGTAAPDQAVGNGCVYPSSVRTVADQLQAKGLTWRGYMEDMGTPCRHPQLGAVDDTQKAEVGDQYAARHNPFVYFHSIIDSPSCAQNVLDLSQLTTDLARTSTTPNLSFITPNLCDDAHDAPCVDGRPGGLASADEWLKVWAPKIMASPAFKKDGLLVVTFDEADVSDSSGADACCGEGPGPNAPLPGLTGLGGGRTGTVLVSPYIVPGSWNDTGYNHYGLLRTIEDLFGLAPLGYAQTAHGFGLDVFGGAR